MKGDLVAVRKQAEQAVQDMAEGDLKLKAFETILAHLLSSNAQNPSLKVASRSPQSKKDETPAKVPKSLANRILVLKAEGFFDSQKSIAEIRQELKVRGWHYPVTSMSGPLQSLTQKRELRRERVDDEEGRSGWKYSNP